MFAYDRVNQDFLYQASPLFQGLDKPEFDNIIQSLRPERWSRSSVVMSPVDTLQYFYVLIKGRVKVMNQNPETGREITLFLLGPGDGFNIVSLLDSLRHDVTVVALDEVEALSAPVEQWWSWMERYPALHRAVHQYIDAQLQQLNELPSRSPRIMIGEGMSGQWDILPLA